MLQKRIAILCFVSISLSAWSCKSSKSTKTATTLPGTWQAQPIAIDGDTKDWPSPYPNYDAKAKVAYATSNDKYNLYITMETGDEQTQMKILSYCLPYYMRSFHHPPAIMIVEISLNYTVIYHR